ncbi:MAG TPA: lipoate--protein ligase family protein [Trueperaceae bacterium]|nr:lipoate--protein ligase family protein [Trueperaceae bacterium]
MTDNAAREVSSALQRLGHAASLERWRRYPWQLLTEPPETPAMHMAQDEVLLDAVARGDRPPSLRIWEWASGAVVLGRYQSVRNEVDEEAAAKHGLDVVRRITGGGAMFVLAGGVVTYSLYAPLDLVSGLTFQESYAFLDGWVVQTLRDMGVDATWQPVNDIASPGGKIGGAAQTRRGGALLHHVTMAYDLDPRAMASVLRVGREKLSGKGIASAALRPGRSGSGFAAGHLRRQARERRRGRTRSGRRPRRPPGRTDGYAPTPS